MGLQSMGRFVGVAFPMYIVMGHLLNRLPRAMAAMILVLFAYFLATWAALFAARYPIY
jgi:hypothetical protein